MRIAGKAGGFLAAAWGDGTVTEQLHRQSFALHEELARILSLETYRKIPTLSVAGGINMDGDDDFGASSLDVTSPRKKTPLVSWLDGDIARASMMDPHTAQVTPKELVEALAAAAKAKGATFIIDEVTGLDIGASTPTPPRICGALLMVPGTCG